jgi:YhcH/YjgK/YiaL family protein
MIIDTIENKNLYTILSPRIRIALDFLKNTDFSAKEPGRYDIDGENIFALVQEYQTIPRSQGKWECHQKYIDIQYIAKGNEQIGFGISDRMEVQVEYNHVNDVTFLKGQGDYATLTDGSFGIFYPSDAHQPKIAPGDVSGQVKKVVIKIKVN